MQIQDLQREFKYNSVKLPDPNPQFTLTQVRDFFSTVYPEIISADIEGPEVVGNKNIYSFRRAVGTKGSQPLPLTVTLSIKRKEAIQLLEKNGNLQFEGDNGFLPLASLNTPVATALAKLVKRTQQRRGAAWIAPSHFMTVLP